MYIAPNTTIRVLHNVPLDNTYNQTIYFSSVSAQSSYFSGLAKYTFTHQTYQRVQKGRMRVEQTAENLYDCNYLMFQNTSFGNKWFYAFITGVEYINNAVSEISFEIDVMQTWFFDFTLEESFVEREHTSTDGNGEHLLPEPVELGEYVFSNYSRMIPGVDLMCIVVGIADVQSSGSGGMMNGVFSGNEYWAYNTTDISSLEAKITPYIQSPDSIVTMYMCPSIVAYQGGAIPEGGIEISTEDSSWSGEISLPSVNTYASFQGYTPKNHKLYSYPYAFIHVDNANGSSLQLRQEFFASPNNPSMQFDSINSMPVKVVGRPKNYKLPLGTTTPASDDVINTEIITLENYPMCSWNIDAYKVWLSQNIVPYAFKAATGIATTAIGVAIGAAGMKSGSLAGAQQGGQMANSGLNSLLGTVTSFMMDAYTASIQADLCKGSINNGNVNVAHGYQNIYAGVATVTGEYAKAIDDFFTVFGYSVKRVKVPNTHARPYWTYTKTAGCVISGNVPADDAKRICQIHDNGITYWTSGANIGNYSLDNSPVTTQ